LPRGIVMNFSDFFEEQHAPAYPNKKHQELKSLRQFAHATSERQPAYSVDEVLRLIPPISLSFPGPETPEYVDPRRPSGVNLKFLSFTGRKLV
jgi:hypothetical protein